MMDGLSIHQFFFWVKKVTSLHYTLPSSSLPPSSLLVAKVKMKQIWEVPSRFLAFKGLVLQWFFTLKFCQTKLTISKWIPSSNSCGCILLTFGSHSGTTSNIVEYWSGTSKICTALTIQKVSRHSSSVFQQQQLFLKVFIEFPWTLGVVGLPNWDGELWGAKGSTMTLQPLGISQPKVSMWSPKKNGGRGRGRVDVGGSNRSGFLWEFNPFLVFFHWKKWGGVDWLVKITNQVLSFQKKMYAVKQYPHVVICEESVLHFFFIAASLLFERERSLRDPTVPPEDVRPYFQHLGCWWHAAFKLSPPWTHQRQKKIQTWI